MAVKTNIVERIERNAGELRDGECWETTYKCQGRGGHIHVRSGDQLVYLHRVAWEAHNAEPIPEGMIVRHTCDNPACINPEHLVLGTHKDNTADMINRGRAGWQHQEAA